MYEALKLFAVVSWNLQDRQGLSVDRERAAAITKNLPPRRDPAPGLEIKKAKRVVNEEWEKGPSLARSLSRRSRLRT